MAGKSELKSSGSSSGSAAKKRRTNAKAVDDVPLSLEQGA